MWRIWWYPNNASKWQMGFNLTFKGLTAFPFHRPQWSKVNSEGVLWPWGSWTRASWYNYENNQQDALYRLIYYFTLALHVSGDVFSHHQEHLTLFTVSGSVHPSCCRLVSRDTSSQHLGWTLPDTVNTVKCSWWWAKTSPETCRDNVK